MFWLLSLITLLQPQATGGTPLEKDVESFIVAMERAALDRSDRGDATGFLEISDPDVVYMDPFLDAPIYGLEELRKYYAGFGDTNAAMSGKMSHVKVQVTHDIAVLTFCYTTTDTGKGRVTRWHTTEVYRRGASGWRIIHTHWSLLKSPEES